MGVLALDAGCIRSGLFTCETNTACAIDGRMGVCELEGVCSFSDPTCSSGRRFAEFSGNLSNRCVGADNPTDGGADAHGDASASFDAPVIGDAPPGSRTVTFGENGTETYGGVTIDTYLDATKPTNNFGSDTQLHIDPSPLRVALLRFDLSALPTSTQVFAAELHIYVGGNTVPSGSSEIFRVLEAWDEGTFNGAMGVANWNQRTLGTAWLAAGASPPSRDTVVLGSVSPTKANQQYVIPLDASGVAVVNDWVHDPASNHGLVFPPVGGWAFESSESTNQRPALVLTVYP
jgi:hypothetical protein